MKTDKGKFFKACFENDIDTINDLLINKKEEEKLDLYTHSNYKYIYIKHVVTHPNALQISCMNGSLSALKLILKEINGIDINETNFQKFNNLHLSAYFQQY